MRRNRHHRRTSDLACAAPAGTSAAPAKGFTLIEMLVVITILAALTMIAVQSLGPVEQRSRYEATQRTLERIRDGVVMTNDSAVSGFVADTGRVPNGLLDLTGAINPATGAVNPPSDLAGSGVLNVQTGPDWNGSTWEVTSTASGGAFSLNHGWRGPYVTPTAGSIDIVDGWGYSLIADPQGIGTFVPSTGGVMVRTLGAAGGAIPQVLIPAGSYSASQISGNIYSATADVGPWCVALVGPGSAAEGGIAVYCVTATVTSTTGGPSTGQPVATYSMTASSTRLEGGTIDARAMYVGPRVLCAVKGTASSATRTGSPKSVVVRPGAQTFDLYVP